VIAPKSNMNAASDVSWILEDVEKAQVRITSPAYTTTDTITTNAPTHYKHSHCLPVNGCYRIVLRDASASGQAIYRYAASFNGYKVAESNNNADVDVDFSRVTGGDFGSGCRDLDSSGRGTNEFGRTGGAKTYGIMFDVQAKEGQNVSLLRFASLHMDTGNTNVKIFTKNGSYKGYESNDSAWTQVLTVNNVVGKKKGIYTWLSNKFEPMVTMLSETTQAFYILTDQPNLYYNTESANEGDLWKSFDKYNAFAGTACVSATKFRGCRSNVVAGFEGHILAAYVRAASTFAPTEAPAPVMPPTPAPQSGTPSCSDKERLVSLTLDVPDGRASSGLSWSIEDVANAKARVFSHGYVNTNGPKQFKH
jgi:hypothetical protein